MSGLTRSRSGAAIARYTPYNASGRPVASQRTSTHPHPPPNPHLHSPYTLFTQDPYNDHSGPSYALPTVFSPTHAESGFASHNPPVSFPVSTGGLAASAPQAPSTEVLHIEDVFLAEVQLHYGHYNPFLVIFSILSGQDDRLQHSSPASVVDDLRLRVKSYAQENTSDLRRFRDMIYFHLSRAQGAPPAVPLATRVTRPDPPRVVVYLDLKRLFFDENPTQMHEVTCQWNGCGQLVTPRHAKISQHLNAVHEISGQSTTHVCLWTNCGKNITAGHMATHLMSKDHFNSLAGQCNLCLKPIGEKAILDHLLLRGSCRVAKDPTQLKGKLRERNLVLAQGQTRLPTR